MTIEAWLRSATEDAERRGIPALKPILDGLAKAVAVVRAADFNDHANDGLPGAERRDQSHQR